MAARLMNLVNKQSDMSQNKSTHFTTQQWSILTVVLASYLVILLDTSIVITGLPQIRDELGFSRTGLSWVQNAYTLSFGGLLLLGARAGDLLGRKRVFSVGLALFVLASLVIGLSQSAAMLIAARAIQGLGAAILAPSTLALLSISFAEGQERVKALAYYAATAGIGASLGLLLGGVFAGWLSWRVGFFINIPIGLILLVLAQKILPETEQMQGKFDLKGAVLSVIGMAALVYGIESVANLGWNDFTVMTSIIIGVALLAWFILHEKTASHPLMPLRLFASRIRVGAYLGRMLFLGAMVGFFFFSTQMLQGVLGFSAAQAGMGFLPMTVTTFLTSMMVPRLTQKWGNDTLLLVALLLASLGMFSLAQVNEFSNYWFNVALPMVLVGLGNGAALGPLTISGVTGVSKQDAGAASGVVNVAHQIGGTLGLSVLVVVFASAGKGADQALSGLAYQLNTGFIGSMVMLLLAAVVIFYINIQSWQKQTSVSVNG